MAGRSDLQLDAATIESLFRASAAERWHVPVETFTASLIASVAKRFEGEQPSPRDVDAFARSLHLADLALACACRAGHEAAWEHFIRELRPSLYAAARAIARDGSPEELVDSLFGDLFGLTERDGQRRSLLAYYHGRARLSTWLRTVLAQRHVDAIRVSSRHVALDDEALAAAVATPEATGADPRRSEYVALAQAALDGAVAQLDARDRLRLRLYYAEELTLARIGRLLGEHEATVSRKLDRTRKHLKQHIERTLSEDHRMPAAAVAECLQTAAASAALDVSRALARDEAE